MSKELVDTSTIPGWGVDVDPENNPTYPMRHVEDQERGLSWTRPSQQEPRVEVLQSIEYDRPPAVTGTSTPPSGMSGAIRRYAFRRSESDWWHWLLLMGADRINVVEGVMQDIARGKLPNVPGEMGVRAEWRHNRKGFVLKSGVTLAIGGLAFAAMRSRRAKPLTPEPRPADGPVITNKPLGEEVVLVRSQPVMESNMPAAPIIAPPMGAQ